MSRLATRSNGPRGVLIGLGGGPVGVWLGVEVPEEERLAQMLWPRAAAAGASEAARENSEVSDDECCSCCCCCCCCCRCCCCCACVMSLSILAATWSPATAESRLLCCIQLPVLMKISCFFRQRTHTQID